MSDELTRWAITESNFIRAEIKWFKGGAKLEYLVTLGFVPLLIALHGSDPYFVDARLSRGL